MTLWALSKWTKITMLQRFNFVFFQKALPGPNRESPDRRGGRWLFRLPFCDLAFLLGPTQRKTFLSNPRGKGEVFTLRLAYSCSQRQKKRELRSAATVPPPLQRLSAPAPWFVANIPSPWTSVRTFGTGYAASATCLSASVRKGRRSDRRYVLSIVSCMTMLYKPCS
jgi:hypothetical protein